jgi:hypothetical protein
VLRNLIYVSTTKDGAPSMGIMTFAATLMNDGEGPKITTVPQ